jgi:hypothetical protein
VAARAREARNWLVFMVIKVVMIRFWTGPPCVSLIAGLGSSPVTGREEAKPVPEALRGGSQTGPKDWDCREVAARNPAGVVSAGGVTPRLTGGCDEASGGAWARIGSEGLNL